MRSCGATASRALRSAAQRGRARAMAASSGAPQFTNRLVKEETHYLLQHAHNPVDWFPWGEEAFAKARAENKPIFLSVGYATCHWCHVMEHESFESEAVAEVLNKHFVSIKVDKESRPDVDRIYMQYLQATGAGGGWPMSVWLTPSLAPFVGGTYFPPDDRYGRKGFTSVLRQIADMWETRRADVEESAADVLSQLRQMTSASDARAAAGAGGFGPQEAAEALAGVSASLLARFDKKHGGFGGAPKFPRPCELDSLLSFSALRGADAARKEEALGAVVTSLRAMCSGGIHDHLAGGFARYSVDATWHVPHFEKMLYDNAQLVVTLLDAALAAGKPDLALAARSTLDYLLREMTRPDGGLYSAQDADSLNPATGELQEGYCYAWTDAEIAERLGQEASAFRAAYDVRPDGNCGDDPRSDPQGEFRGLNVLRLPKPLSASASADAEKAAAARHAALAGAREALYHARAAKPPPRRDDKVIVAWNGMAISALARASRILSAFPEVSGRCWPSEGRPPSDYLAAAEKAAEFIHSKLYNSESGTLRRNFLETASPTHGFADDYSNLALGLCDLYEASGNVRWLTWALELQATLMKRFGREDGAVYSTEAGADASILIRLLDDYDGAEPAASSIAAKLAARLAGLVGGEAQDQMLRRFGSAFGERLATVPVAMPTLCAAVAPLAMDSGGTRVLVVGRIAQCQELMDAAWAAGFAPDRSVVHIDPEDAACTAVWEKLDASILASAQAAAGVAGGKACAVVCQGMECRPAVYDGEALRKALLPKQGGRKIGPFELPAALGR